jgi:hypothetical protein
MRDNIFASLSVIKSSVFASIRYVDRRFYLELDGDRSLPYRYDMSLYHNGNTHSTSPFVRFLTFIRHPSHTTRRLSMSPVTRYHLSSLIVTR